MIKNRTNLVNDKNIKIKFKIAVHERNIFLLKNDNFQTIEIQL